MKNKSALPLTLTALALVLATPQLAMAKAAHVAKTIDRTSSGDVDNTRNGMGTWTRTVTGTKGDLTITKTETFADGKTLSQTGTVMNNGSGTVVRDMTDTNAKGKVSTVDTTTTATGTAGDYDVTSTITNSKGVVNTLTGTRDTVTTNYGTDTTISMTNSAGASESLNAEHLKTGDAAASVVTGTGFKGQAVDFASLRTTNGVSSGNDVDTTVDGQGTYTASKNVNGNMTTYDSSRSFADGAKTASTTTVTQNGNGTSTYDSANSYTSSGGTTSTSSSIETYTPNSNGDMIQGSFNQSGGGYYGSVNGSYTNANYGHDTNLTYTNQDGATRMANTQTLQIGGATLNVNTGTNFAGAPNNSVGLIASASQ